MMDDYRLFVNEDRTVMVHLWPAVHPKVGPGAEEHMEVATREHPDAIWGPPVFLKEEK